ncbi:MAG: hypothetical protein JW776_15000 [Candidatus Lokiarchaeota archaeon]|nr:hypothetical protein [Candidatus Lokiarchaeota archaeon]
MAAAGLTDYLILLGIVVGMTVISQLFRYFFGMRPEESMDMQQKLKDMQNEMVQAREDPVQLQRLQQEAMQTYRTMMRKQLIPNCIYMILFFGLWYIVGLIFSDTQFFGMEGDRTFFFPYLIFSFSLSGIIWLIRYLIRQNKKKKGLLPDENYDASLDRGIKSGVTFSTGWARGLSPELQQMRTDLQEKRDKGELPHDIDIDAEIQKIAEEEEEDIRNWKKRLES